MISVANSVLSILKQDETGFEACIDGILNYSAYADRIHKQVEEDTLKKVKKGTIVSALSRIAKGKLKDIPTYKPTVRIQNLNVRSPICSLIYEKTSDVERRVATLNPFLVAPADIFSITEGTTEIALSCTEKAKDFIKKHIGIIPKREMDNVAAITAQFSEEESNTPNLLHVLFTALAHKRINLLYVVSAYTEISYLVEKKDMEDTLKILDVFTKKS
ncbi:MAG TPA: ACT domain-containing protein [Patescibacteria group bacterium]|nr:ACT domain-containing protein [Patescibacteria group bacterium]